MVRLLGLYDEGLGVVEGWEVDAGEPRGLGRLWHRCAVRSLPGTGFLGTGHIC